MDGALSDAIKLIGRVTAAISGLGDPARALESVLCMIAEHWGFTAAHGFRLMLGSALDGTDVWWQRGDVDISELQNVSGADRFEAAAGALGEAIGSGLALWTEDLTQLEQSDCRDRALAAGLRSSVTVPIMVSTRAIGVMEFFAPRVRPRDEMLLAGLGVIGQAAGAVLESIDARHAQSSCVARAHLILDNARDSFIAMNGNGVVVSWNRAAEQMYGWSAGEAIGRDMADMIMPPEYRAKHEAGVERFKRVGYGRVADGAVELEALRRSGERFPVEMAFWGLEQGGEWEFFCFARDITDRKAREADLIYRADHDELTGLANRTAVLGHLAGVLTGVGQRPAVIVVALDRFKITRERLGHQAADRVLQAAAGRLADAVHRDCWVARIADDEFLVVCPDVTDTAATRLAERITAAVTDPYDIDGDRVAVQARTGIVMADPETDTAEGLLRDVTAGVTLDQVHATGQVVLFDGKRRDRIRHHLGIERELARAIERDELRLFYQPVVDVTSARITGVEALVRWDHPEHGVLSPAAFIDVAEESGLILPLGDWVLSHACRQATRWQQQGAQGLAVGINLSARQFGHSGLVRTVVDRVREAGIDLDRMRINLEVTETLLMNDVDAAVRTLSELRDHGFGLAIDDFGTGYSSLGYLKSLPVDIVKIDRSFVTGIATDMRDRAIVTAITQMGGALGMAVLAEGVEDEAQWRQLQEIGCGKAQGFYFGRPMPEELITARLGLGDRVLAAR